MKTTNRLKQFKEKLLAMPQHEFIVEMDKMYEQTCQDFDYLEMEPPELEEFLACFNLDIAQKYLQGSIEL